MKDSSERIFNTRTVSVDQRNILGISLLLLLATSFTFNYLINTYYPNEIFNFHSPAFWMHLLNCGSMFTIVMLNKKEMQGSLAFLGLNKPQNWWKSLLVTGATLGIIVLFTILLKPLIDKLGPPPDINFLMGIKNSIPNLIFSLILVWVTGDILEEIVFRSFLINSLDLLFGRNSMSQIVAVVISSLIFGGIHAYQGIPGMITTTCLGLIFGIAFLFNGRRIWPLIVVHMILDTTTLLTVYQMQ